MSSGVRKAQWDTASSILSMLYNINKDPKADAKSPADFHPYEQKQRVVQKVSFKEGMDLLGNLFKIGK